MVGCLHIGRRILARETSRLRANSVAWWRRRRQPPHRLRRDAALRNLLRSFCARAALGWMGTSLVVAIAWMSALMSVAAVIARYSGPPGSRPARSGRGRVREASRAAVGAVCSEPALLQPKWRGQQTQGELNRFEPEFGQTGANPSQIWPTSGKTRSKRGRCLPRLGRFRPMLRQSEQERAGLGTNSAPRLARARFGRGRACFGPIRPNSGDVGRFRLDVFAQIRHDLGQGWPGYGQILPSWGNDRPRSPPKWRGFRRTLAGR